MLTFSLFSQVANGQDVVVVVHADDPATEGLDYYIRVLKMDFTGWSDFELLFDSFKAIR